MLSAINGSTRCRRLSLGKCFSNLFYDETNDQYILVDGFHRLAAHKLVMPNDPILAETRLGNVEDARWAAIIANKSHGIRRTNEDKRNAVTLAILHPKGADMSNRQIAEHVGVHHVTVGSIRRDMESTSEIPKIETRTVQRGSQTYLQNTERIGTIRSELESSGVIRQIEPTQQSAFNTNTTNIQRAAELPWRTFIPTQQNNGPGPTLAEQDLLTTHVYTGKTKPTTFYQILTGKLSG